jgi:hypothetical protein
MAGKFKAAFGGILRSLHQLWLEVTGTFLIVFAAAFGYHAFKEYRKYSESANNVWWIVVSSALSLLTLSFGIHSFWKARKLR